MSDGTGTLTKAKFVDYSVEAVIHIGLLVLLVSWCFQIIRPFIIPVVWGVIIAVALYAPFRRLRSWVGGRGGLVATIFVLLILALLFFPTYWLSDSLIQSGKELTHRYEAGTLAIPPPPETVADWPLVGKSIYKVWHQASVNLEQVAVDYEPQLRALGGHLISLIRGYGGALLQSLFAVIIAAAFLAKSAGGIGAAQLLSRRIVGDRGEGFVHTAVSTIRGVAVGVVGVAMIQSVAAGLGMLLAGVPGAGLWALLVLVIAVVQLPPLLVLLPVIIYLFAKAGTLTAVVFLIWAVVVSASDSFLKPLFMGRGQSTPTLVILIGAIGGMMMSGIIGLFVGAVVLALGYELLQTWLRQGAKPGAA
jgi:predicted PurR-regulated permease PerM